MIKNFNIRCFKRHRMFFCKAAGQFRFPCIILSLPFVQPTEVFGFGCRALFGSTSDVSKNIGCFCFRGGHVSGFACVTLRLPLVQTSDVFENIGCRFYWKLRMSFLWLIKLTKYTNEK